VTRCERMTADSEIIHFDGKRGYRTSEVLVRSHDAWTSSKPAERDLLNGLSRRERTFILKKIVGRNDKDAALAAGYSLSMAENTKRRIWKPRVLAEFQRLQEAFELQVRKSLLAKLEAKERNATEADVGVRQSRELLPIILKPIVPLQ